MVRSKIGALASTMLLFLVACASAPAPTANAPQASASPFKEALDVDEIIKNLTLDRPLKLFIPNKEKYPQYEFRIINGIAPEHIPRLTERFYRVDMGRSRGQGGSGLGLAIVKHALQRHGGWLDVQSIEGKGSTFTCHFPSQRVWHSGVRAAASA